MVTFGQAGVAFSDSSKAPHSSISGQFLRNRIHTHAHTLTRTHTQHARARTPCGQANDRHAKIPRMLSFEIWVGRTARRVAPGQSLRIYLHTALSVEFAKSRATNYRIPQTSTRKCPSFCPFPGRVPSYQYGSMKVVDRSYCSFCKTSML